MRRCFDSIRKALNDKEHVQVGERDRSARGLLLGCGGGQMSRHVEHPEMCRRLGELYLDRRTGQWMGKHKAKRPLSTS